MKKALTIFLCVAMIFCFFSCGKDVKGKGYEIAMITDFGTIDDKSVNQGAWEGLEEYAKSNEITYKYYQPTEDSTDARLEQIDLAVQNGAKVIATPGNIFEETIFTAQDKYPEVKFILIDGNPHDADFKYNTADNTVGITFAEQEAGYLAGYAAVKSGYTKLGFMGGVKTEPVIRYGYGFVAGANDAAEELNKTVDIKYEYTGTSVASPEIKAKAAELYSSGTEVIFSCGGEIFDSISAAAEGATGAKVIGADVDQSSQSKTVITSAMKGLDVAVKDALDAYYNDKFPGGEEWVLGAKEDAVGIPMDTSKFESFTAEDYNGIFEKLKAGEVKIPTDKTSKSAKNLAARANLDNVNISLVE